MKKGDMFIIASVDNNRLFYKDAIICYWEDSDLINLKNTHFKGRFPENLNKSGGSFFGNWDKKTLISELKSMKLVPISPAMKILLGLNNV